MKKTFVLAIVSAFSLGSVFAADQCQKNLSVKGNSGQGSVEVNFLVAAGLAKACSWENAFGHWGFDVCQRSPIFPFQQDSSDANDSK